MEVTILPPKKIYVKKSPIHGLGVFAGEKITKDEMIEECPILTLPINQGESSGLLLDYKIQLASGN